VRVVRGFMQALYLRVRVCAVAFLCARTCVCERRDVGADGGRRPRRLVGEEMVANRRHLHENPELGFEEVCTAAFIVQKLHSYGFAHRDVTTGVATTGVVAIVRGAFDGPCIAIRADMDALPIVETTGCTFAHALARARCFTGSRHLVSRRASVCA
jgi:hypothetical protein